MPENPKSHQDTTSNLRGCVESTQLTERQETGHKIVVCNTYLVYFWVEGKGDHKKSI